MQASSQFSFSPLRAHLPIYHNNDHSFHLFSRQDFYAYLRYRVYLPTGVTTGATVVTGATDAIAVVVVGVEYAPADGMLRPVS